MERQYYVYIMTNKGNTVLYTGITWDLKRRVYEHKEKLVKGFTKRCNITKLVHYEIFKDAKKCHHEGETDKGWFKKEED